MFRWLLILLVLLSAIVGLLVGVLNATPATLDLLAVELTLPLGGLVLLAFAAGLLGGLVLAWLLYYLPGRIRRSSRSRNRNKGTELADRPNG